MAWYRKYRPQRIADLQIKPVREQLLAVLQSGQVAHAYLFAGPKGTGKTSAARILARVLNDPANAKVVQQGKGKLREPDSANPLLARIAAGQSQVVIELDAASHRGIDDVRHLQEMIAVAPAEGLVRVVILDEAHMLTNEAFNALLKSLEEPPERVIFVLATTEPHRVPVTIQSRCEMIQFRQATTAEIEAVLEQVAAGEKIKLTAEQIKLLAEAAQGSFRDAVKYFEQVARGGAVDDSQLAQLTFGQQRLALLLHALAARDSAAAVQFFQDVRQKGENWSALEVAMVTALQNRLHRALIRQEKKSTAQTLASLLDHLVQRLGGSEPVDGIKLEIACLTWCLGDGKERESTECDEADQPAATVACARPIPTTQTTLAAAKEQAKATAPPVTELHLDPEEVAARWPQILLLARTKSQVLEAILRQAQLGTIADSRLELVFTHGFHQEQLNTPKYQLAFLSVLAEALGEGASFVIRVQPLEPPVTSAANQGNDLLLKAVEEAVLSLD